MTDPVAISGIDDPTQARVMLWQSKREAHAPLDNIGLLTVADAVAGYQPLDATLTALAAFNTNGILTQTAANTFAGRTITAANTNVVITDGNGVSGNPTIAVSPVMGTLTTLNSTAHQISVPSWVKRVTITFRNVSTNGTVNTLLQIGDAGGIETSGYLGAGGNTLTNGTAAFIVSTGNAATSVMHGTADLVLMDAATNLWAYRGDFSRSNAANAWTSSGNKALSAALTTIEFNAGGTDVFDGSSQWSWMFE